jgi:RNA polymerase sigma-70 factor, ECF subfamily
VSTALGNDLSATVAAATTGDELAFARIVAAYDDDMARVAYLICGDVTLAHEAVQAAWSMAWRRIGSLRDRDRLRGWLMAIAGNEARQLVRRRKRRSVIEVTLEDFDDEARPTGAVAPDDQHLDLMAALRKLSPEDREIVAMRYVLGFTSFEIAIATGRSAPGVRSRLARALVRLREDLGDD